MKSWMLRNAASQLTRSSRFNLILSLLGKSKIKPGGHAESEKRSASN